MNVPQRFFKASVSVILLLAPVLASPGFAQTQALAVDDLAKRAEVVAVGRVADMKSEWSADRTHIMTRVTLSVQEYVKGGEARVATLTVATLGGEVGEVGELYTHVPTFRPNENVVVFLEKGTGGDFFVSGGTHGKYLVERDPISGDDMVVGEETLAKFIEKVKKAASQ